MHLDLQHHQTARKGNIRITSGSNSTVWTTGVLTRSQCKWRGSFGCSVGQCRCWVPSHSWCCCHCFLRVGCSWCYPWSWDLPDLRKNNWGSGTYCWILDTRILSRWSHWESIKAQLHGIALPCLMEAKSMIQLSSHSSFCFWYLSH